MNADCALERLNYFEGQLLGAADFEAEQGYFLAKMRRHNRYLHGWGVVAGLEVSFEKTGHIVVAPGVAIDCAGNEIIVCEDLRLKASRKQKTWFVVVEHVESPTKPGPARDSESATGSEGPFTRIREDVAARVVARDPCSRHGGIGPGTPGCGRLHAVCIARVTKRDNRWSVELKGRRGE
jgi:hypothetical protein